MPVGLAKSVPESPMELLLQLSADDSVVMACRLLNVLSLPIPTPSPHPDCRIAPCGTK